MSNNNNQNSWAPYDSYRDCSLGICSIYCPQWCYMAFNPPPPFDDYYNNDPTITLSPFIIALIAILATAFLLIFYYTVISNYYCNTTRTEDEDDHQNTQNPSSGHQTNQEEQQQQWVHHSGLDEEMIKSITVCRYKRGDGLIEGTDCAVCLSEFCEDEGLRLLPNCSHAFHLPCIDTWLKSHSNCPLCRSNVVFAPAFPNPNDPRISSHPNVSSPRESDVVVLVVDDDGPEEVSVREVIPKNVSTNPRNFATREQFRRSVSLGSFACRGHLSVADILRMGEEEEEEEEEEIREAAVGIGSSRVVDLSGMRRSVSDGRFMFKEDDDDKGKISVIIPN